MVCAPKAMSARQDFSFFHLRWNPQPSIKCCVPRSSDKVLCPPKFPEVPRPMDTDDCVRVARNEVVLEFVSVKRLNDP
ncbi:hypothetical protein Pla52n_22510 [Stieleria varia]|uniref:Uncharacterized protein n=1 Tax=Stieleria varia TaxID=2528005 RepID=A0A5C6B5F3_9BACT|nr:hypothetical protein Pla52n_22510 [Stieleria varia]